MEHRASKLYESGSRCRSLSAFFRRPWLSLHGLRVRALHKVLGLVMPALLLAWPLLGTMIIRMHRQHVFEHIEKATGNLPEEQLTLSKAQFPKLDRQREFELGGKRYDIIRIHDLGDRWQLAVYHDVTESKLVETSRDDMETGKFSWLKTEFSEPCFCIRLPEFEPIEAGYPKPDKTGEGYKRIVAPPPEMLVLI